MSSRKKAIGDEAFQAVTRFFDYDRSIPLDPRILERSETPEYSREKIVFTGGRGNRVPGLLALPKQDQPPYRIVLQLHGGASSKESWWQDDSLERGGWLTRALLDAGIAVLALDAQYHGERSAHNDYLSIREMYFEKQWFGRYRDGMVESTRDWLRALDYLAGRAEIRLDQVGVIGYSMGGIMAFYLAALEPRIATLVSCVGALSEDWLYPLQPAHFGCRIRDRHVLLLGGRSDSLINVEDTEHVFASIRSPNKELEFFDSEHQLPEAYVDRAVSWLCTGLE